MTWVLKDDAGNSKQFESRAQAEDRKAELEGFDASYTIEQKGVEDVGAEVIDMSEQDGGNNSDTDDDDEKIMGVDVCVHCENEIDDGHCPDCDGTVETEAIETDTKEALDTLGESIENDPLNVLPKYMITTVDGQPSLNKRGVSVLAYHYDVSVTERTVVAYPHDHKYETAVVEIMVEGGDGRTFSGIGEAHVDETPKHQLLRMAETRAYKRAVIFATGTGIVSYQEMVSHLEGGQ